MIASTSQEYSAPLMNVITTEVFPVIAFSFLIIFLALLYLIWPVKN